MNSTAEEYNQILREKMYLNTVINSLLLFLGVAGNCVVLYFYAFRMPRADDRYFIPCLAAVDLVACVFGCVFAILMNFYQLVFVWEDLCKLMYFLYSCTTCLSALMLLVIALYRYLRVCRPHGAQMTKKRRTIAIFCSILGSIMIPLPSLYFIGKIKGSVNLKNMDVNVTSCGLNEERVGLFSSLYLVLIVVFIFMNIMCTVALYIPVGMIIYKRFVNISNSRHNREIIGSINLDLADCEKTSEDRRGVTSNDIKCLQNVPDTMTCKNSVRQSVRHNFTFMFITIVVFYVISYVPTAILIFVGSEYSFKFWYSLDDVSLNVLMILRRSYIINHIVNPYIYGYFDLNFRRQFIQSVCVCKGY
jgi:hypothetical protein